MKGVKDFYDKIAKEASQRGTADETMLPYLREFMACLPPSPRVLDLGCGTGCESRRLRQLGAVVTGLDFSEESIHIARELNPEISFMLGDMLDDYSELGPFDGCVAIASLIHLPVERLHTAFERISSALHMGGYLLVVVRDGVGKAEDRSYTKIDGEEYDREFYLHTCAELQEASRGQFQLMREISLPSETAWKHYLFQKL